MDIDKTPKDSNNSTDAGSVKQKGKEKAEGDTDVEQGAESHINRTILLNPNEEQVKKANLPVILNGNKNVGPLPSVLYQVAPVPTQTEE